MAVREYGTRSIRWRLGGAQWGPFDGGLNLRDSYTEVAPTELTDGTNLTLDERGVASKRNDCPASADFPAPPGSVDAFFYSRSLALAIIQVGTTLYKCAIGGGSWTSFKVFAAAAPTVSFVDFKAQLVFCHGTDGVFTYDGAAAPTAVASVFVTILAAWQNKVWAAGDIGANITRVWWSNAGNAATWTTGTDFVDLREKDDKPVTALFGGSGLLAFKEDSAYRINNSTDGAYQTIDWTTGCAAARAVIGQDGRIVIWGVDGLYSGNGLGPFQSAGDRLRPRFLSTNVNTTTKPSISATAVNGRVYFAFPRTSATIPDGLLEFNPRVGWLMESSLGGAQIGPLTKYVAANGQTKALLASGSATIKELLTGTTRTGFSASLTTSYVEPFGGRLGRLTRLTPQVFGTAGTAMTITVNYIAISGAPATWTSTFTLASASGTQRPTLTPKIQGSAFQVTVSDPNNIASFSLEAIDADFVLSSLR